MAFPIHTPRVNNNDDVVRLVSLAVAAGDFVNAGDIVAAVETDKSVVDVAAEKDGYVLGINAQEDHQVAVGSVLIWQGASADELVPETAAPAETQGGGARPSAEPTAKARVLLERHGIDPAAVPYQGDRLGAADVEAYLACPDSGGDKPGIASQLIDTSPDAPGRFEPLNGEELGMLRTVLWHRDQAVPAYLEIEFDQSLWQDYATQYAERHRLMLSPLLPLLAHHLARIAGETPKLNATIVNDRKYLFDHVNLGFTIQADETLYLSVVRQANKLPADQFVLTLADQQRRALAKKLEPEELQGATLAFTSMGRWNVGRHIPILPPHTPIIVAHSGPAKSGTNSIGVLGATYDHRLLSGSDVVTALRRLAKTPAD